MKNKILKIAFAFILFSVLFVTASFAVNIKEDVANYTSGAFIIGSTRFDTSVTITAEVAAKAGVNEAKLCYNLGKDPDDSDMSFYYYNNNAKQWYKIGESVEELKDATIVQKIESNLNIFFVNNVEKELKIPYKGDVNVESISHGNVKYDEEKEEFTVPATTFWFRFQSSTGVETFVETKVDTKSNETFEDDELIYGEFIIKSEPQVKFELADEVMTGEQTEFTVSTVANDYAGTMIVGVGGLSDASTIEKLEYFEVKDGKWYEMPKDGQFGAATGFPLQDATSKFRVTFNKAGVYTVNFEIKNAEMHYIMASASTSIVVREAPEVKFELAEEIILNEPTEFTVSTIANDYAGVMVVGTGSVNPDNVSKLEYAVGDQWVEMTGESIFGSSEGFPLQDATSKFRVTFDTVGEYDVTFAIKDVETGKIMADVEAKTNVTTNKNVNNLKELQTALLNKDITNIKLLNDIEVTERLDVKNEVVLNLNGKTIKTSDDLPNNSSILVWNTGKLTIEGEGTVNSASTKNDSSIAIWAYGGEVIINGGTYTNLGTKALNDADKALNNELIYTSNGGKLTVNGGKFIGNTENATHGAGFTLNKYDKEESVIEVKGGTFVGFNPADNKAEGANTNFVAKGYKVAVSGNEYTVKPVEESDAVVVNGNVYASLNDAIENAPAGATVTMFKDAELTKSLEVNKELEMDLNGHTLSATTDVYDIIAVNENGIVTLKNGNVKFSGKTALAVYSKGVLNVESDVTITGDLYGVFVAGQDAKANIRGTVIINEAGFAVGGNGSAGKGGTIINIDGATIEAKNGFAVYLPQEGTANISGGKLTGKTVIGIKAGTLNVTGGDLIATGASIENEKLEVNNSGIQNTGDIIFVECNAGYADNININLSTKLSADTDSNIIRVFQPEGAPSIKGVTGGYSTASQPVSVTTDEGVTATVTTYSVN